MKKLLMAFTVSLLAVGQAYAGSTTVPITAGTGTNVAATTDGSLNIYWRNTLWDYAAGANGAGVDTSHGLLVDPASAAAWGVGATGSTVPANANYMGIISSGNLVGWTGAVAQGAQGSSGSPWYIDTASTGNLISALNAPVPGNASTNCSTTGSQSGTIAAQSDQYGVLCNDVWLWGGIVLGAATNFGTSPGAVKVPGVNANSFFSTANAPTTPHICGSSATLHASTNSDLTIVPVSGSTTVYICDYEFEFTGVGAFYFESATTAASSGSTCSGSLTQIPGTGLWTGQASNPIGKGGSNAFYRGVKGPSSNGLCLHTTTLSSTTLDVTVFYDQY